MSVPANQKVKSQLLQACDELERALRAGEPCSAKQLLETHSNLAANKEASLELIYTEFVVRRELGEQPPTKGWLDSFPQWRSDLNELFQVHELIGEEQLETSVNDQEPTDGRNGAPTKLQPGQRIGQYDLLEEIGRGGMGVVYKARQRGLNRLVAVKMILSAHASQTERARFRLEAEAASQLQHPNIVQIHEVGTQDNTPYMAMELVEGPTLHKQLADHPLSPQAAATLVKDLAGAIDFAHQSEIVHRDLKPANILQAMDGTPKITDFGLAKQLSSGDLSERQSDGLTKTGALLGTPSYMAPEQADAKFGPIGPATDIYALGVILYEAMTGRLPFHADTPIATLEQVRNQEPVPPRRLLSSVPRDLETICLKCLQKEQARRYTSAALLAADLQRQLVGEPIVARRTGPIERSWRWCQRKPLAAALLALLALAIVAGSAGVISQWRRAEHNAVVAGVERDQAEANYQKARDVVDRLTALSNELSNHPGAESIRQRTLEEALTLYESLLEQRSDDPVLSFETARAALRAGTIQHQLGRHTEAERTVRRGIEIVEALLRRHPHDVRHQHELARCNLRLGHVLKDTYRSAAALNCYSQASHLWHDILSKDPRADYARSSIALALMNAYAVLNANDDITGAEQMCYQSIEWQLWRPDEQLPDVFSASTRTREFSELIHRVHAFVDGSTTAVKRLDANLAIGLDSLCLLLQRQGRFGDAEEACRLAIQLGGRTVEDQPNSPDAMYYLARSQKNLGDILLTTSHATVAEAAYERAVVLQQPIVAGYPLRPDYRTGLIDANKALASLLRSDGRPRVAEQPLRDVCDLLASLVKDFPEEVKHYRALGRTLTKLGQLHYHSLQQLDAAIAEYQHAIDIYEQLVKRFPDQDHERVWIGILHRGIAVLHAKMGRTEESEASFATALALFQALVDEYPDNESFRTHLAAAHFLAGERFAEWHRYSEAAAQYEAAIRCNPELTSAYNRLAWLLANCPDTELRNTDRAVQVAARATEFAPKITMCWKALGIALYRDAKWEKAVIALETAIAGDPYESSYDWLFLAMAHWQLGNRQLARECFSQAPQQMPELGENGAKLGEIRAEGSDLLGQVPTTIKRTDERLWSTVETGCENLLAQHPDAWWLYERRAYARAALDRWQECGEDLAKAYELHPELDDLLLTQAGSLLMAGDHDAYQALCVDAVKQLESSPDRHHRYLQTRICLLATNSTLPAEKLVSLAHEFIDHEPSNRWYLHLLGLAFYRAGEYELAIQFADRSMKQAPEWSGHVTSWLVIALAHQQLGDSVKMDEWKRKAETWVQANRLRFFNHDSLLHPHEWLECMLLKRELAFMSQP